MFAKPIARNPRQGAEGRISLRLLLPMLAMLMALFPHSASAQTIQITNLTAPGAIDFYVGEKASL